MRKTPLVAALVAFLAITIVVAPAAQAEDRQCVGTVVNVATLTDQTIDGNLIVPTGSTCYLLRVTVNGNVLIEPGGSFTAVQSEIKGDIKSDGAKSFRLNEVKLAGNVQLKKTTGPSESTRNFICNNSQINGEVKIEESGPGSLWAIGSTSGGCDPPFFGNIIRGNLIVLKNEAHVDIALNRVLTGVPPMPVTLQEGIIGSVQVFSNTGGASITLNDIDGNLQCKDNVPAPTGSGNTVRGNKEDQCAGF